LLPKLHFYGIRRVSEACFRSYLTNRRQKLEVKSPNSTQNFVFDWGTLKSGIPHETILGTPLFIIYINDLHLRINSVSEPILFADDISVKISRRNSKISVQCQI
jgi:hypothetical protein